jgi:hypothetical protein
MDLDIKPYPRAIRWISETNQYFNLFLRQVDSLAGLLLTDTLWLCACSVLPSLALLALVQVLNTTLELDHQNFRRQKAESQKQTRHADIYLLPFENIFVDMKTCT